VVTTTTFTLNLAMFASHLVSSVLDSQLYALDVHHQRLFLNIFIILPAIPHVRMVRLSMGSTVQFATLLYFVQLAI